MMIALLWVLNFAISWFNAWAVGTTWDSTKARGADGGGYGPHFMNWMGAVMSASGFTWCYLVVLGVIGSMVPMSLFVAPEEGAAAVTGPLLDPESLRAFFELGYLVIVFPVLGSGLAITVQSWRALTRARHRSAVDYAVTGWNTFAQVHNTMGAIQHIPGVLSHLGSFFKGGSSSDAKGKASLLVVVLAIMAVCGGILTTFAIVQARRRAVVVNEYLRTQAEAA